MGKLTKAEMGVVAVIMLWLTFIISVVVGIGYIIIHFITKFW